MSRPCTFGAIGALCQGRGADVRKRKMDLHHHGGSDGSFDEDHRGVAGVGMEEASEGGIVELRGGVVFGWSNGLIPSGTWFAVKIKRRNVAHDALRGAEFLARRHRDEPGRGDSRGFGAP